MPSIKYIRTCDLIHTSVGLSGTEDKLVYDLMCYFIAW